MTTLVTWSTPSGTIRQAVSKRDPADIFKEMNWCVANDTVATFSLVTLKAHVLAGDE